MAHRSITKEARKGWVKCHQAEGAQHWGEWYWDSRERKKGFGQAARGEGIESRAHSWGHCPSLYPHSEKEEASRRRPYNDKQLTTTALKPTAFTLWHPSTNRATHCPCHLAKNLGVLDPPPGSKRPSEAEPLAKVETTSQAKTIFQTLGVNPEAKQAALALWLSRSHVKISTLSQLAWAEAETVSLTTQRMLRPHGTWPYFE